MYPDAGGHRPTFRDMGDRLAALGYAVLVPDIYYRSGGYEPFSMDTVFTDPDERARLGGLIASLPPALSVRDAGSFLDFLAGRDETVDGPVGTTGYCLGGHISLLVAGHLGGRIGAAASFHGGHLAREDNPESPHLRAADVEAVVHVGYARDDDTFPAEQVERLTEAYEAAGVSFTIEEYPALHGFAVPDNPTFDEAAAARHWTALQDLYAAALPH